MVRRGKFKEEKVRRVGRDGPPGTSDAARAPLFGPRAVQGPPEAFDKVFLPFLGKEGLQELPPSALREKGVEEKETTGLGRAWFGQPTRRSQPGTEDIEWENLGSSVDGGQVPPPCPRDSEENSGIDRRRRKTSRHPRPGLRIWDRAVTEELSLPRPGLSPVPRDSEENSGIDRRRRK